jgi:hypothetical protein
VIGVLHRAQGVLWCRRRRQNLFDHLGR